MLNIIVCIKQVIDPEAPKSLFRIDSELKRAIQPNGTPLVLNPFDENALEAALRLKAVNESKITVVSMGRGLAKGVLMKSLAVGADELLLLEDVTFEGLDSYATAYVLATAIRKVGEYDLLLTGRQAADWDAGAIGSGIAEILGIPSITVARKVELNDRKLIVERVVSDGYEIIGVSLPALVTVGNELGELRSATTKDILAAKNKPITTWGAQELGVEPSSMKQVNLLKLFIPPEKATKCEIAEGETPEEAGANLALKLREAQIL